MFFLLEKIDDNKLSLSFIYIFLYILEKVSISLKKNLGKTLFINYSSLKFFQDFLLLLEFLLFFISFNLKFIDLMRGEILIHADAHCYMCQ